MASNIDATKPTTTTATTQSVRDNFAAAKAEIEALQESTGIADGSITDAKIGNRTIDQALSGGATTGLLTSLLSWIGKSLKAISGETNWYDAPGTTLKSHVANSSNPHTVTAGQLGLSASGGSALVGFIHAGTGAVLRTLQDKNRDIINVKDFGAVGDKVTDDAPAIQLAIDYARDQNHGTIYFPNAVGYRTNSELDVTGTSALRFIGESGNNSSYATIYPNHTGHTFDCTDSSFLSFEEIAVRAFDNTTLPKTAWFLARPTAGYSSGQHHFRRCASYGKFTEAVVYSYGSESNEYYNCYFVNTQTSGKTVVVTAYNILGLSSNFATVATGGQANIHTNFFGGSIAVLAGTGEPLYLDGAALLSLYGTWMASSDGVSTRGTSLITIDNTNSASDLLTFSEVVGENFGGALNPTYAVYYKAGASPTTCYAHHFRRFRFAAFSNGIYGANDVTIDGLSIDGLTNVDAGAAGTNVDKIQYASIVNSGTTTIRTSCLYSELHGAISSFSLPATRTGTVIYDVVTGSIDRLRGITLTVPTNPADVSVPTATATTLFSALDYLGGGQLTTFTFGDDASILGKALLKRTGAGTLSVEILGTAAGAGVALSISGNNVQLTHTVGTTRTVWIRLDPASATVS